jgi:enoyl-CoA hydratase/carnithine racemase
LHFIIKNKIMVYNKDQLQNFWQLKFAFLIVEEKDHVLSITLNRPDKKNAMNPVMMAEIAYCLSYAHYNNNIWVIVLAAMGDTFCAGADLKAFAGDEQEPTVSTIPKPAAEILLGELFIKIHKPCIAKVHANLFAGGFLLVCGCTYVIASDQVSFSLPEVKRGIWPMQVMQSLMQIMPSRKAIQLCMLGEPFSASQAKEWGIVTKVVDRIKLDEEVINLARSICKQSPTAIRMGLEAFDEMRSIPTQETHAYLKKMLNKILQTQDAKEGLSAFKEKREPIWTGT